MRSFYIVLLTLPMIFSLCACDTKEVVINETSSESVKEDIPIQNENRFEDEYFDVTFVEPSSLKTEIILDKTQIDTIMEYINNLQKSEYRGEPRQEDGIEVRCLMLEKNLAYCFKSDGLVKDLNDTRDTLWYKSDGAYEYLCSILDYHYVPSETSEPGDKTEFVDIEIFNIKSRKNFKIYDEKQIKRIKKYIKRLKKSDFNEVLLGGGGIAVTIYIDDKEHHYCFVNTRDGLVKDATDPDNIVWYESKGGYDYLCKICDYIPPHKREGNTKSSD